MKTRRAGMARSTPASAFPSPARRRTFAASQTRSTLAVCCFVFMVQEGQRCARLTEAFAKKRHEDLCPLKCPTLAVAESSTILRGARAKLELSHDDSRSWRSRQSLVLGVQRGIAPRTEITLAPPHGLITSDTQSTCWPSPARLAAFWNFLITRSRLSFEM